MPDIVTVSKSISGSGLPMSLVLMRPEVDVWKPGAHTGTFRGNNLAFISARVALEEYWADAALTDGVPAKSALLSDELARIAAEYPEIGSVVRGRGLMYGLASTATAPSPAASRRRPSRAASSSRPRAPATRC